MLQLLGRWDEPWGLIVVSKSGTTLETAVAFRVYWEALGRCCSPQQRRRRLIVVTGPRGPLRTLARELPCAAFDVPEGIGGRFSVLTPVGLVPAGVLGLDLVKLLQGAEALNARFVREPVGQNPVLDYAGMCHLWEGRQGTHVRVLAVWSNALESLGLWYDQLLSESLGKEYQGATPVTAVNTRDLHSRGQQHQQGRRDKLITNLVVRDGGQPQLRVPASPEEGDHLEFLTGRSYQEILAAALQGTNQAYRQDDRPTIDLLLPRLDEATLGQVFQFFMLATVVEGKLLGVNPYGQPGVKQYKENMLQLLTGQR